MVSLGSQTCFNVCARPNCQLPHLGYPVRLRAYRSERGWEGFFVEPVFLFDFTDDAIQRGADPALTGELPIFNFRVLKSLAMGDSSQIMDEAARLAEELGFSEAEPPETDEFIARLVEIREDWDWKEPMNPGCLSSGTPLDQVKEGGIYNRVIVFGCERSPYTKGLEQELAELQKKTEEAIVPRLLVSGCVEISPHSEFQSFKTQNCLNLFRSIQSNAKRSKMGLPVR